MSHEFEVREEITLTATPDQVWDAIATGPGIDSWFMGRNEVEPGPGGTARTHLPGFAMESTITAWEPGQRYATRTGTAPDGAFMADGDRTIPGDGHVRFADKTRAPPVGLEPTTRGLESPICRTF